MNEQVRSEEAARALDAVEDQQRRTVTAELVPRWYWAAVGGLVVAFTAATESGRPVIAAAGTVLFVAGIAVAVGTVVARSGVQIRNELLGTRGGLVIAGFVLALVAVSLLLAWSLVAAGVSYPATIASLVTFAGLTIGGPLLMRYLGGVMAANARSALRRSR